MEHQEPLPLQKQFLPRKHACTLHNITAENIKKSITKEKGRQKGKSKKEKLQSTTKKDLHEFMGNKYW